MASALEEPAAISNGKRTISPKARRWTKLLLTFAFGQTGIQLINAVTGLLLMRWMTVTAYAQYSAAFVFQCSVGILVDLGFNNSVIPLVGDRGSDLAVIGKYVRAAKTLRIRNLLVVGSISALVFPIVMRNQPWPWQVKVTLWTAVIAAVFFSMNDIYRAPLLIHKQIAKIYRTDVIPAIVRLTISFLMHSAGWLYGWIAAWFSAFNFLQAALMLRRAAKPYVREPETADPEATREIINYLKPIWPGMIYYAFQGSLAIGLIAYFGKTSAIAQTAALGRLSIILTFLTSASSTILVPEFAKSSGPALQRKVLLGLGGLSVPVTLLTIVAFCYPKPFMFLLGSHYQGLDYLVGPVALISGLTVIGHTLNFTALVKKWVTSEIAWLPIIVMLSAQATYIFVIGVQNTRQAIGFQLTSATAFLVLWGGVVVVKMRREVRNWNPGLPETDETNDFEVQAIENAELTIRS